MEGKWIIVLYENIKVNWYRKLIDICNLTISYYFAVID